MSNRLGADPIVHLHWVRETPSRGLLSPVSQTLDSLKTLPSCVQETIRDSGLPELELHLPPFRQSHCEDPAEWFASLRYRFDAVGRLVATSAFDPDPLATMAYHQGLALALRAISGDTTPLTIVAELPGTSLLRRPLALRHTCGRRGGLAGAPAERAHHYDRTYKTMSLQLQTGLREALPPAHVQTIPEFEDRPHVQSLFAWSAAAPVVGRHVDQLGVDVLNAGMVERAHSGIHIRMAPRLAEARDVLARHRVPSLYRDSYNPGKALRVAQHCRRHPQYVNLLFSNELRLITTFVRFCASIDKWRHRSLGDPARVFKEVRTAWSSLEGQLRFFYQRRAHSALGSRMLLEAARHLEAID